MTKTCRAAIWLLASGILVYADDEAANRPVVRSSQYGATYAKSIPAEPYGQKGKTKVFSVRRDRDTLISEYDWYASEIYLGGAGDATLIRFGPWHRDRKPQADHLAIGIYRDGKMIKEYSTVEIVKLGGGPSESVSHYRVFGERMGFRWLKENTYVYEVKGVGGNVLAFDLDTGNIIERSDEPLTGGDGRLVPSP